MSRSPGSHQPPDRPHPLPGASRRPRVALVAALAATLLPATLAVADTLPPDSAPPGPAVAAARPAADPGARAAEPATAIAVDVPVTPRWMRGTDGRIHINYDLVSTNWIPGTVTLTRVQVLDPRRRVLLDLSGGRLASQTHLLSSSSPTAQIPASASVATGIDAVLPSRSRGPLSASAVPATLTHRVSYSLPGGVNPSVKALVTSTRVGGPQTRVNRKRPIVLAPPLRGDGWLNGVGCCDMSAQHRRLLYAADGRWLKPETFAVDWLRVVDGAPARGDGSDNSDWYNFGAKVYASKAGVVVRAVDGRPDIDPGAPAQLTTADSFGGNYVVVKYAKGVYVSYLHLKRGSVAVRVGERVRTGDLVGRLGNSGNTTAPHLHFGVIDKPDFATAGSLPYVFNRFRYAGTYDEDSGTVTGKPHSAYREYPLLGSVSEFGR